VPNISIVYIAKPERISVKGALEAMRSGHHAQLSKKIRIHGIRQQISIISLNDSVGFYEVISGEIRMRAARIADLEVILCIMIKETEHAEELALQ
jgi:ParB-like chromosome segregation protein Spo0J